MTLLSTAIARGSHASRPAAGTAGFLYYETDTFNTFRDNGSSWDLVSLADIITTKGDLLVGNAADVAARLGVGTDGQVLTADAASTNGIKWAAAGSGSGYLGYISVQDQKTANTAGGTFTSGSYVTRTLNTEVTDTNNDCSLAANQITLAAGTYECLIHAPGRAVNRHKARLRNVTDGTTVLVGSSAYCDAASGASSTDSVIVGRFTIAASKALEVQHQAQTTCPTNGLGVESNMSEIEVYTIVELRRVS